MPLIPHPDVIEERLSALPVTNGVAPYVAPTAYGYGPPAVVAPPPPDDAILVRVFGPRMVCTRCGIIGWGN